MSETPFPPTIASFHARLLTFIDLPALQGLIEQCADYIELVSGSPPSSNEAEMLIASLPPGRTLDDKFLIGIFDQSGEMIGLIDAVKDYPVEGVWWLGLQLLAPEFRGAGIGEQFYRAFENWIIEQGATQVQLGVLESNPRALVFWERLGFILIDRKTSSHGGIQHQVHVMQRSID